MLDHEFRKLIVATAEKQLKEEGYEMTSRSTFHPKMSVDEYSSGQGCSLSVNVCVTSDDPLAATVTLMRRNERGETEIEQPFSVRPVEAEARVREAIARALAKSGEVTLSRVLSLVPVQAALLQYLEAKETAKLLALNRSVRAALSTKQVDVSYWKVKLAQDFPNEIVRDASSPTAYRHAYATTALRVYEEEKNRKRGTIRLREPSPDPLEVRRPPPPYPANPFGPRPIHPDPLNPFGPFGAQPDRNPFGGGGGFPFNRFDDNPGGFGGGGFGGGGFNMHDFA